jgi:hypothetical protein
MERIFMTRRFVLLAVLAVTLSTPVWLGRSAPVEAAPKPAPVPAACKAEVGKLQKELIAAREAQRKAEAGEAAARAELEKLRAAERERLRRLESQTGVAAEKLN